MAGPHYKKRGVIRREKNEKRGSWVEEEEEDQREDGKTASTMT